MGTTYILINESKKEMISFTHLPSKKLELAGNVATSSITTWYMLKNTGDQISFIPDYEDQKDYLDYKDITEEIIDELVNNKILLDAGFEYQDPDDPETYIKKYKNIWDNH